jgi:hypothetical protein
MVISHKYKYLFIELPRTGSTAISAELRANYDGSLILYKHATYLDFLKRARPEEKKYFVFSGIRNPLDDAVSAYLKYKTNHHQRFTNPTRLARNKSIIGYLDNHVFNYIKKTEAGFPTYLRQFYKIPYSNWSSLSHKQFDFIIRFENLAEDFATLLNRIGIEPVRALPSRNNTSTKNKDYLSYYTPDTIPHAKRIFGPFMQEWGYNFPPEWGDNTIPWWNEAEYKFFNVFRGMYWRYVRPRIYSAHHNGKEDEID